jgi:hypothetical protein
MRSAERYEVGSNNFKLLLGHQLNLQTLEKNFGQIFMARPCHSGCGLFADFSGVVRILLSSFIFFVLNSLVLRQIQIEFIWTHRRFVACA